MANGSYIIETVTGNGMDLATGRIRPTVQAVVKFDQDGAVAWRGKAYWQDHAPRSIAALAGKARKRWQTYYDQTGKRFEVKEREKREAKQANERAEQAARRRVRDTAPELLASLRKIVAVVDQAGLSIAGDPAVQEARGVIAQAEGTALEGSTGPQDTR